MVVIKLYLLKHQVMVGQGKTWFPKRQISAFNLKGVFIMEDWKKARFGIAAGIVALLLGAAIKHGISSTDQEEAPTIPPDDFDDDPEVFAGITQSELEDIANKVAENYRVAKVIVDGKIVEMYVRSHGGRGTWPLRTAFNDDGSINYDNCANPYSANVGRFIWEELSKKVKEAIQSKESQN